MQSWRLRRQHGPPAGGPALNRWVRCILGFAIGKKVAIILAQFDLDAGKGAGSSGNGFQ